MLMMGDSIWMPDPKNRAEVRQFLEYFYGSPTRQDNTPRQRVESALQRKLTDRIPFDFWAVPELWQGLHNYFDVRSDEEVLGLLGIDCRLVAPAYRGPAPIHLREGVYVEPWGSLRRLHKTPYGSYEEYASFPLANASVAQVEAYKYWPVPDQWDASTIGAAISRLGEKSEYHLRFESGGVFESAWGLYGLEPFLICMATGEMDVPNTIMACYTELFITLAQRVLEAGKGRIDMVYLFDDIGTQRGPLFSVKMWREYILPWQRRLVEAIRPFDVRIMYHSCGAIYPFIRPLIEELKIDVLNPLQPRATGMDLARIKGEFGSRMAFHGGIDIQETLPHGNVEEVRQEVRRCCQVLGAGGGYICAPAHNIQADVPVENVIAMYTTPRDFSKERSP